MDKTGRSYETLDSFTRHLNRINVVWRRLQRRKDHLSSAPVPVLREAAKIDRRCLALCPRGGAPDRWPDSAWTGGEGNRADRDGSHRGRDGAAGDQARL